HAFEEAMRIALEVPAILEGARLALVDVHRHQARLGLRGDALPLAPDREAGAAQAAPPRVLPHLGELPPRVLAREAVGDKLAAAALLVSGKVDVFRLRAGHLLRLHGLLHRVRGGIADRVLADDHTRRDFAAPNAGRMDDSNILSERQLEQFLGTS